MPKLKWELMTNTERRAVIQRLHLSSAGAADPRPIEAAIEALESIVETPVVMAADRE